MTIGLHAGTSRRTCMDLICQFTSNSGPVLASRRLLHTEAVPAADRSSELTPPGQAKCRPDRRMAEMQNAHLRHNLGMAHLDVDGMRIAYRRAGIGPVLVMLHGAPTDSRTWQWMLPGLARDHTVIAWDAPGFGASSDIDDSWRAPQFADALAAFVAALGLERPHLVGHSFGTMIALSLFQRHPAVPASLVLVGGYAGWAGSLPPEEVARRLEMFVGMAELGDAFDPKSYPGLFSEFIPPDREAALATMMRENIRPATVRAGPAEGCSRSSGPDRRARGSSRDRRRRR